MTCVDDPAGWQGHHAMWTWESDQPQGSDCCLAHAEAWARLKPSALIFSSKPELVALANQWAKQERRVKRLAKQKQTSLSDERKAQ